MNSTSKRLLICLMALLVGYLVIIRVEKEDSSDGATENDQDPLLAPLQEKTIQELNELIEGFIALKAGHFSSLSGMELLEKLQSDESASLELAKQYQRESTLEKRLLGLFMELEVNKYSEALGRQAIDQDSILFGAMVAQWLYLRHEFDDWSEFMGSFSETLNADKAVELFGYIDDPDGERELPPSFGLFRIGEIDDSLMRQLIGRSPVLQGQLKDLLIPTEVSSPKRNTALILLKKSGGPHFNPALEHFLNQYPENSQTHKYLSRLGERSTGIPTEILQPHIDQLQQPSPLDMTQSRSVEVILDVVREYPDFPIEDEVLSKVETFLTSLPMQTHTLKQKIADVAHARWLARSR